MSKSKPPAPLFALMGATATGKTGLAMALAERFPIEIVSVDSVQVYRGLDIGTAKPDQAMRAAVRHHLIDVVDPAESYSAARFRADALRIIAEVRARERWPLLVGGTLLYFRALLRGLSALPSARPDVREALASEAARDGWPALHARLAKLDPTIAARLHPNDSQRIQRALEIATVTGSPPSQLQGNAEAGAGTEHLERIVVEVPDRAELHRRIEDRFRSMIDAGFLDEVRALHRRQDLEATMPAVRAVGYRQLWAHLEGSRSQVEAINAGIAATRQLARRQLTWLRAEHGSWRVDATQSDTLDRISRRMEALATRAA